MERYAERKAGGGGRYTYLGSEWDRKGWNIRSSAPRGRGVGDGCVHAMCCNNVSVYMYFESVRRRCHHGYLPFQPMDLTRHYFTL